MKWRTTISPPETAAIGPAALAVGLFRLGRVFKGTVRKAETSVTENGIGEFQALVLSVVNTLGEDAYGMRIRDEVQALANKPVHMPQVYAALSRLEIIGSLVSETNPRKSAGHRGRTRRYYKLTARGLQLLSDVVRLSHGAGPKEPDSNGERKKAATA